MDIKFMRAAYREAEKALCRGEIPVGAVLVMDGKIIARAYNRREEKQNALAHAEITVIDRACKRLKSWRLDGAELYVTLEPCAMCAGAMANARIKTVVYGAAEKKSGAAESVYDLRGGFGLNTSVEVIGGVLEEECSLIIKDFFARRRKT